MTLSYQHRGSGTMSSGDSVSHPTTPPQTVMDVDHPSRQNTPASERSDDSLTSVTTSSQTTGETPSAISGEPRIHTGSQLTGEGARRSKEEATEQATHTHASHGEKIQQNEYQEVNNTTQTGQRETTTMATRVSLDSVSLTIHKATNHVVQFFMRCTEEMLKIIKSFFSHYFLFFISKP